MNFVKVERKEASTAAYGHSPKVRLINLDWVVQVEYDKEETDKDFSLRIVYAFNLSPSSSNGKLYHSHLSGIEAAQFLKQLRARGKLGQKLAGL